MRVLAVSESEEGLQVVLHQRGGVDGGGNRCVHCLLCCSSLWRHCLWAFFSLVKEASLLALGWLCEELVVNVCWDCNLGDVNLWDTTGL